MDALKLTFLCGIGGVSDCAVCQAEYAGNIAHGCHLCSRSFETTMYFIIAILGALALFLLWLVFSYLVGNPNPARVPADFMAFNGFNDVNGLIGFNTYCSNSVGDFCRRKKIDLLRDLTLSHEVDDTPILGHWTQSWVDVGGS